MIFHIPHSSIVIPKEWLALFCLKNEQLSQEILVMTDHHTESLFAPCAGFHDFLVISPVSRLLVDMERFDDDASEPMAALGMGVVYNKTADGRELKAVSGDVRGELLNKYYHPHHKQLESFVSKELSQDGLSVIIDCHSFPSQPFPYEEQGLIRPDICIGSDKFHTPIALVEELRDFAEKTGLVVAINQPFCGSIVPRSSWRRDNRIVSVMIEINRKLYINEATGHPLLTGEYQAVQKIIGGLVDGARRFKAGILGKGRAEIARDSS